MRELEQNLADTKQAIQIQEQKLNALREAGGKLENKSKN